MKNIIVITGNIHSGKTTFLQKQILGREDVEGILTPKINGKRYFQNIATQEIFEMEDETKTQDSICIGKYFFNKYSFNNANDIIKKSIKSNYIVIDEIGPLELNGEGLYSAFIEVLHNINESQKIILVIRESILKTVFSKFSIQNKILRIINVENSIYPSHSIFN